MKNSDWEKRTFSLHRLLGVSDHVLGPENASAYGFLQDCGVVPASVRSAPRTVVRHDFDVLAVPAWYLASAAWEWDSWGASHPSEFIEAIMTELDPVSRDFVASLLTSLGRAVQ